MAVLHVNSKNRLGGYVGETPFVVMSNSEETIAYDLSNVPTGLLNLETYQKILDMSRKCTAKVNSDMIAVEKLSKALKGK